jgi:hypothetical protein
MNNAGDKTRRGQQQEAGGWPLAIVVGSLHIRKLIAGDATPGVIPQVDTPAGGGVSWGPASTAMALISLIAEIVALSMASQP